MQSFLFTRSADTEHRPWARRLGGGDSKVSQPGIHKLEQHTSNCVNSCTEIEAHSPQ